MIRTGFVILILCTAFACNSKIISRIGISESVKPIDYADINNWAALPGKIDSADATPDPSFIDRQAQSEVDVFFLHPTTYTQKGLHGWNASLHDQKLNRKTDRTTILHQATTFNGAGRVYAPRYRQAHLSAYFTKKEDEALAALDFAYQDVKTAFNYYLAHYHQGRPIIIAAHSQGTTHAKRLIKDFFENKPLQAKLVVAYLVGIPVTKSYFQSIPLCTSEDQTGCYCSWRAYKSGHFPKRFPIGDSIAVTNPLSWKVTSDYVGKLKNRGGVLQKFHGDVHPGLADAQVMNGVLWVSKPKFPGSFLITTKNYHVADFNFFYVNIRENAKKRANAYLTRIMH